MAPKKRSSDSSSKGSSKKAKVETLDGLTFTQFKKQVKNFNVSFTPPLPEDAEEVEYEMKCQKFKTGSFGFANKQNQSIKFSVPNAEGKEVDLKLTVTINMVVQKSKDAKQDSGEEGGDEEENGEEHQEEQD